MAVYFECTTRTSTPRSEFFDLARSVDVHKDSMAQSREVAVAGVTSGRLVEKLMLAGYLQRLIETRNRHLAGHSTLE